MRVVTSFGPDGYELYGKKFLQTYVKHVGLPLDVYIETDKAPDFNHALVRYRPLFKIEGCAEFLARCDFPAFRGDLWNDGKRNYRYDIYRFCRKSFAQIDAAARNSGGWLYWIDADVEFKGKMELPTADTFMLYMGRPEWHSCCSFLGWNLDHPVSGEWWKRYWMLYVTGTVFALPEWHDSYVVDWLRNVMELPAVNLAQGMEERLKGPANVFNEVFPMAHHKKGGLKHAA